MIRALTACSSASDRGWLRGTSPNPASGSIHAAANTPAGPVAGTDRASSLAISTVTRLRPFRNSDPPALARLWNLAVPRTATAHPLRVHELDTQAWGKPTFEADGLIVAARVALNDELRADEAEDLADEVDRALSEKLPLHLNVFIDPTQTRETPPTRSPA